MNMHDIEFLLDQLITSVYQTGQINIDHDKYWPMMQQINELRFELLSAINQTVEPRVAGITPFQSERLLREPTEFGAQTLDTLDSTLEESATDRPHRKFHP
jgi:hypothetical protein